MRRREALGPAVAGSWYPGSRDGLATLVDGLLEGAAATSRARSGPMAALVVPHAGFTYSGAVAASAFAALEAATIDRILLLGPSHYFGFRGAAIPDRAEVYRTPLHDTPIDREALTALSGSEGFAADDRMFAPEHALEAELPFLQRVCDPDVPIVPVLLGGGATSEDTVHVAAALAPMVTPGTLVVVSSDFTHFGARFGYTPFADDLAARIRKLDRGAIDAIESGDAEAFARYVETTGATICGHRAIEVLLRLPGAPSRARLIEYDTSGRMTGSFEHSVSYAALAAPAVGRAAA